MHHKAHPFKVHNSVVFSRHTKWCNCQHYLNSYIYIHINIGCAGSLLGHMGFL